MRLHAAERAVAGVDEARVASRDGRDGLARGALQLRDLDPVRQHGGYRCDDRLRATARAVHGLRSGGVDHAADAVVESATPAPDATLTPDVTPAAAGSSNRFVLVEKRLWDPYENGGSLDGPSVHCGDGRELVVNVLDANGSRINGVAVQAQYGAREIIVTGAQGKGDGVAEFVLGGGQDVKVIRDNDGSPASSDLASGLSTNPQAIPHEILIAGQYCQDEATCRHFAENNGCLGHFSWTVTFQRQN